MAPFAVIGGASRRIDGHQKVADGFTAAHRSVAHLAVDRGPVVVGFVLLFRFGRPLAEERRGARGVPRGFCPQSFCRH